MAYDLHVHTNVSDGSLSPQEVIDLAIKNGLDGIAITDHDTPGGIAPALRYIQQKALRFSLIPGIELNTDYKNEEVHILGYYIDDQNDLLLSRLQMIKAAREKRAENMVSRLQELGLEISLERVKEIACGHIIARPHIGQALMEKGFVMTMQEAFGKYIDRGRPAYVPRYKFKPEEAIELIKNAGGIAILAHPGHIKENNLVNELIGMGIEGLEVYYPSHSEAQVQEFLEKTKRYGLVVTGGSDFHRPGGEDHAQIGEVRINNELIKILEKRWNQNSNKIVK